MAKPMIQISINDKELKKLSWQLGGFRRKMAQIVSRSINKATVSTRVEAARQINEKTGIKITIIKKGLNITKATLRRWASRIHFSGRRIPVINLGANQTNKGVTYRSTETKSRKLIKSAFKAMMPKNRAGQSAGHLGVFRRKINSPRYDGRLPIGEQFGPSLKQVFSGAPRIVAAVVAKASRLWSKELTRQIDLAFKK